MILIIFEIVSFFIVLALSLNMYTLPPTIDWITSANCTGFRVISLSSWMEKDAWNLLTSVYSLI